jgi:hypothetical protein
MPAAVLKSRPLFTSMLLLCAALALAGCGGGDGDGDTSSGAAKSGMATTPPVTGALQ